MAKRAGKPDRDQPAAGNPGAGGLSLCRTGEAFGRGDALRAGAAGGRDDVRPLCGLRRGGLRGGGAVGGFPRHGAGVRAAAAFVGDSAVLEPHAQRSDLRRCGGDCVLCAACALCRDDAGSTHRRGGRGDGGGAGAALCRGAAGEAERARAAQPGGDHQPVAAGRGRADGLPKHGNLRRIAGDFGAAAAQPRRGVSGRRGDRCGGGCADGADARRDSARAAVSMRGAGTVRPAAGAGVRLRRCRWRLCWRVRWTRGS